MAFHSSRYKSISRRAMVFGGLQLSALAGLASRLYYLQFVKAEHLSIQAENNRIKLQLVPPARGTITDRRGEILAENNRNFQLYFDITAMNRDNVEHVLSLLKELASLSDDTVKEVLNTTKLQRFPPPFLLKEHLEWDIVAKIKLHATELPGAYIHTGQQRHYPLKEATAHLIGYLGRVAQKDLVQKDDPLLRLPDFKIGKNGVEFMYNDRLIGSPGIRQLEVNANGLVVRELDNRPSTSGETLALTIDARLQQFCTQRLGEESASVVVMDIRNGDVLALVSVPGFDPDIFSRTIPVNYWNSLRDNERVPLLNKAMQGQYPPGSTFKMLVGLAGLEAEKVSAETRVHCPGHYYLGSHRFNCWRKEGHGSVNLKQAIAVSCDTYFYTLAQRLGIDSIADMARRFGLGDSPGLGFPGEKHGNVPDAAWKMASYKQRWQTGDTVNVGIGQGYILATPLQLCTMTARIANGDYQIVPRLVSQQAFPDFDSLAIHPEHLAIIREGMDMVVNHPSGTAYGKRIMVEEMRMAGKTGTSQVKKITQRGQDQATLPWKDRHHAFFVGYAPVFEPRYACCVAIEHGGGGSSAAAPVARDVLAFVQSLEF